MEPTPPWKYLTRKPKSVYRQLFVKDRWIAARTLYGKFMNAEEPMTPEEIAADYDLPLEAVLEAIAYCRTDPRDIHIDHAVDDALIDAAGYNDPAYLRTGKTRCLAPLERAQIIRSVHESLLGR